MPQIRCPKCGTLINLQNRRFNDFCIILKALESKGRTFSELLKITKLPRKTLSLRLKQLLDDEETMKNGKYYTNNGKGKTTESLLDKEIRFPSSKKLLASLIILMLGIPSISLALARLYQPIEPQPLGYLRVEVYVNNVTDVYAWQVGIRYNHTNLKILSVEPGNFLTEGIEAQSNKLSPNVEIYKNTLFFHNVLDGGILVACQTLTGSSPSVNGSGILLIIEFAYFYKYEEVTIIYDESPQYDTGLLRKDTTEIPISRNTITLHFKKL
jgi:hypothetical protein